MTENTGNISGLPEGWKEVTLGDIVDIKSGKRLPKGHNLVSEKTGHHYIRITDLSNNSIEKNKLLFITDETFSKIPKYIVNTGDVIISIVGTIGLIAKIEDDLNNANLTENCMKLNNYKDIDNIFLYYFLISSVGQNEIKLNVVGAVQKKLPMYGIKKLKINLPPLPTQKSIAKILSSFDDKIELLREQNETLEKIGQEIFKEWFGKYKVGDELPEGWREYKLSELIESVSGVSYRSADLVEESKTALVSLKSFDRTGGFQTRGFKPYSGKAKDSQEVKVGDLVVAHTDLTHDAEVLGNPAFIFNDGGFEKMYITTDLVKVNSINPHLTNAFLYYLMKSRPFKGFCVGHGSGTTVLHLSKKAILNYEINLPIDLAELKDLSLLFDNNIKKIINNSDAIISLGKTHDELLPRLMKGEVLVEG